MAVQDPPEAEPEEEGTADTVAEGDWRLAWPCTRCAREPVVRAASSRRDFVNCILWKEWTSRQAIGKD